MIYELKETGRATALFAGWQDSVVWSALPGVMGKIYVDSLEKPESGVVIVVEAVVTTVLLSLTLLLLP